MHVIDFPELLTRIRARTECVRASGITEEDEEDYYNALPYEYDDPQMEHRAFADLILGKKLSREDELLIKQHLDDGDPR